MLDLSVFLAGTTSPALLPDGWVILIRPTCRFAACGGHAMIMLRDETRR
jgi:hypothetical protein